MNAALLAARHDAAIFTPSARTHTERLTIPPRAYARRYATFSPAPKRIQAREEHNSTNAHAAEIFAGIGRAFMRFDETPEEREEREAAESAEARRLETIALRAQRKIDLVNASVEFRGAVAARELWQRWVPRKAVRSPTTTATQRPAIRLHACKGGASPLLQVAAAARVAAAVRVAAAARSYLA